MTEKTGFEIYVGDRQLLLSLGECAVALFRNQPEIDYFAVHIDEAEASVLRVFNNQPFARWLVGRQDIDQPPFREQTGWTPTLIEKDEPSEEEVEMFLDVNSAGVDEEWQIFMKDTE